MRCDIKFVGFFVFVGLVVVGCEGEAASMGSGQGERGGSKALAVDGSPAAPKPPESPPAPAGLGVGEAMQQAQTITAKGLIVAMGALNAAQRQALEEAEQGPPVLTFEVGKHCEVVGAAVASWVALIPQSLGDPSEMHKAPNAAGKPPKGAPRNTRQVREGYWLGSRPETAAEVEALYGAGVRAIISAVGVEDEVMDAMRRRGIEHLSIFFGRKFPSTEKILGIVDRFPADAVFMHCEYGGDRSGVLMAFLLSVRHGWRPDHALLAMTLPDPKDINGLVDVLGSDGLHITDAEIKTYLSAYSGRFGGLKVRNQGYKTLVRSTIAAMSKHGVVVHDLPSEAKTTTKRLGADYDDD